MQKGTIIAFVLGCTVSAGTASYATRRAQVSNDPSANIIAQELVYEMQGINDSTKALGGTPPAIPDPGIDLGAEYAKLAANPTAEQDLAKVILQSFYHAKGRDDTTDTMMKFGTLAEVKLQAIQVAQNQRIIELLEKK